MAQEQTYNGSMLFGGVRGELKYYGADNAECAPKDATYAIYTEFDEKGNAVGTHLLANGAVVRD